MFKFAIRDLLWLTVVVALRLVGSFCSLALAEDSGKTIESQLQGKWRVEFMEFEGKRAEDAVGEFGVFRAGRFEEHLADGAVERGTYELDTARKPYRMKLRWDNGDGPRFAIFDVLGDSLTICGGETQYPDSFKTKKGDGRVAFFYKRETKRKPAPATE